MLKSCSALNLIRKLGLYLGARILNSGALVELIAVVFELDQLLLETDIYLSVLTHL